MIKMKENKNKECNCSCCNTNWKDTPQMIDIMINKNEIVSLCKKCYETMFQKLLKVSCMYDNKLKTKEDEVRIRRSRQIEEQNIKHLSINEAMKGVKVNGN